MHLTFLAVLVHISVAAVSWQVTATQDLVSYKTLRGKIENLLAQRDGYSCVARAPKQRFMNDEPRHHYFATYVASFTSDLLEHLR